MQVKNVIRGVVCAMALSTGQLALAQTGDTEAAAAPANGAGSKKKAGGKAADMQAMMVAWKNAGTPGQPHQILKPMVGKWKLSIKMWMDPTQPPTEATGTAESKLVLGDRFVQTSVSSSFMGEPFNGIATTGYDNVKKKYVGTWVDSMTTAIMRSEGSASADGKVLTMQAVCSDPMTGKEKKTRMVTKIESDDKMVDEAFEKRGGKEVKTMEIVYTRAK